MNFGVEAGIQSQGTARPHPPRQPPGGPATVGFGQGQRSWTEAAAGLALCMGTTWALSLCPQTGDNKHQLSQGDWCSPQFLC